MSEIAGLLLSTFSGELDILLHELSLLEKKSQAALVAHNLTEVGFSENISFIHREIKATKSLKEELTPDIVASSTSLDEAYLAIDHKIKEFTDSREFPGSVFYLFRKSLIKAVSRVQALA